MYKYRLSKVYKQALERDINAKLQSDILCFTSEISLAAFHMISKKKLNNYRHVQDLRKRNLDIESMI